MVANGENAHSLRATREMLVFLLLPWHSKREQSKASDGLRNKTVSVRMAT